MSLDFSLDQNDEHIFSLNITHNLGKMADAAGIYEVLWRPDENGITKAHQCIDPLADALLELVRNREKYEVYNSPTGWGLYKHFVPFVTAVLTACCDYPDADVSVSR